jgi:hypothetical protein
MKRTSSQLIFAFTLLSVMWQCNPSHDHTHLHIMGAEEEEAYVTEAVGVASHLFNSLMAADPEFRFFIDSLKNYLTSTSAISSSDTTPWCYCREIFTEQTIRANGMKHEIGQAHVHQEGSTIRRAGFSSEAQIGELIYTSGVSHTPNCKIRFVRIVNATHPKLKKCTHIADLLPVQIGGECLAVEVRPKLISPSHARYSSRVCP